MTSDFMAMKPGARDFLRMVVGAAILAVILFVVLRYHKEQNPGEQIAFKARRVELVEKMRLALASASEAEKSAVMAITDQDSQAYADEARGDTATVEDGRTELGRLLDVSGTKSEKDYLAQFSHSFAELRRIDDDLLSLAVSNTNLKAYSLAFGPAADAVREMDTALSRILAANVNSTSADAKQVMLLAAGAQSGALRIQALLPPHIAEESDAKMDELEALMAKDDREVRQDLDGLATLLKPGSSSDLAAATSSYTRFTELRARTLKLSRENTNVRSLAISLNQRRKVMLKCQDTLAFLEQAIQAEPITVRTPMIPR